MKWNYIIISFVLLIVINLAIIVIFPSPYIGDLLGPFDNVLVLGLVGFAIIKIISQIKNRNIPAMDATTKEVKYKNKSRFEDVIKVSVTESPAPKPKPVKPPEKK